MGYAEYVHRLWVERALSKVRSRSIKKEVNAPPADEVRDVRCSETTPPVPPDQSP